MNNNTLPDLEFIRTTGLPIYNPSLFAFEPLPLCTCIFALMSIKHRETSHLRSYYLRAYKANSTQVENVRQIRLFSQNKPNFPHFSPENDDFTKKQSQFKPNSNPIKANFGLILRVAKPNKPNLILSVVEGSNPFCLLSPVFCVLFSIQTQRSLLLISAAFLVIYRPANSEVIIVSGFIL